MVITLPPWLEGEDDLSSPLPQHITAYSNNKQAYAYLHHIEKKQWKQGNKGVFLSGFHYSKGDIVLIHHGPHAGQGARVEFVYRKDRKLKQEYEMGGHKIEDVEAKWDITVSLFNNTKQQASVSPRQISLFDPWTKQQRYHVPQPTTKLGYALMPDGTLTWAVNQSSTVKATVANASDSSEQEEVCVEADETYQLLYSTANH